MNIHSTRKLLWPSTNRLPYVDVPSWVEESLKKQFPELRIAIGRDEMAFQREAPECEVLVSFRLDADQFRHFRKLRWIHSPSAGVSELLVPELVERDIVVTNASSVHAIPVAEHAIALVLALARNLGDCIRWQSQGIWGHKALWKESRIPREVNGSTLGLVGLGAIGSEIASRAKALGMRVVAMRRDPTRTSDLVERIFAQRELRDMLRQADYVVITAPETPETRGLIGEQELHCMKATAALINVSRGSLIDTPALLRALEQGTIAAAALDVTDPEPLPTGHPLWQAPNLLITHHMASATERFWQRQYDLLAENLRRYLSGEPLLNRVDKKRGY